MPFRFRPWVVVAVLTFARVAYGLQFQSVGAVGPAIVSGLGLAYASLGTLVGAYSMLGIALALPVGWLTARLGDRRTVVGGLGFMIAGGLILAAAPGFAVALTGRIVSGAGGVLLAVSLPTIIMNRFNGPSLAAAMGTLLTGYSIGIGFGSATLPALGSWRTAMAATAAFCALALAGVAISLAPDGGRTKPGSRRVRLRRAEVYPVIAAGTAWGCINAAYLVLLGFAPVYFVGQGISAGTAGTLVSLSAFAMIPVGPPGGWLLGRLRRPLVGIAACIIATAGAIALVPLHVAPAILMTVVGLALGAAAGPIVALPAAVLAPEHRAAGMGLFWLMFFLLMTAMPPLAGLARDLTGAVAAPLYAAALCAALALPALAAYAGRIAARAALSQGLQGG